MSAIGQQRLTRWDTPFGRWVHETGVSSIVAALGRDPDLCVTTHAVYEWVAGRHAPSPARGIALVRLSGGDLTLEAIYQHRNQVRPRTRPDQRPAENPKEVDNDWWRAGVGAASGSLGRK